MFTLQLKQLDVPPGHRVLLHNLTWQEFELILEDLGERRATRLAYHQGTLEIVAPLPKHEQTKVVISNLLVVLLDELDLNWEPLGSTTFRRKEMAAGIEPDDCLYIKNHALMIGKERIDLNVDPPPDLAIEVDVASKTQLSAYEALGVPEIWRYESHQLKISLLQNGEYVESQTSLTFPNFPVIEGISRFLDFSRTAGTRPALKAFRQWVKEQLCQFG
ncbi:MAG: Uma2 family endonuclease [Leptolyngbyaceae cyanobacterium CSU_1_4]|nr:Uma2 family endonuclease [Leptolyngbyaceae cyanobacterium CSU_1_4]